MNVDQVTSAAVGALGSYFQQIASGVTARVRDSAVERLYTLVAARLQGSEEARQALAGLERQPDEQRSLSEVQRALAQAVEADPALAAELDRLVRADRAEREAASSIPGAGGAHVKVGSQGSLDMRRGVIAGGGVDQSRRFHFGVGGLAGLLAAVALVSAGISAAVTHEVVTPGTGEKRGPGTVGTVSSPTEGRGAGTGSDPCSPKPCGGADGIEIYLSDVRMQSKDRYGEMRFNWRIVNNSATDFEFDGHIPSAYDSTNTAVDLGIGFPSDCREGGSASAVRIKAGSELSSQGPYCYGYYSRNNREPATIEFALSDYGPAIVVELT